MYSSKLRWFWKLVSISYAIILPACNKEYSFEKIGQTIANPNPININRIYEGKLGYGQSSTDYYYSFQFISNNQMLVDDGVAIPSRPGKGVYQLNNEEITGHYQYSDVEKFSIKANFNDSFTSLSGKWWVTSTPTNGGNFWMKMK